MSTFNEDSVNLDRILSMDETKVSATFAGRVSSNLDKCDTVGDLQI